jgi:WhiB family redox-sensing transcriptional regulator
MAACRGSDVNFFPERGDPVLPAKALCNGCEVKSECLATALADPSLVGIWGGTTAKQRQKLRGRAGAHGRRKAAL